MRKLLWIISGAIVLAIGYVVYMGEVARRVLGP